MVEVSDARTQWLPRGWCAVCSARSGGLGVPLAVELWIYLTAPPLGALAAVAASYILRGPGGDPGGTRAARGTLPDAGDDTTDSDGGRR